MQPQRLIVPLFQRPYVWNEENQWGPLWGDVRRVADQLVTGSEVKPHPHFLGAVVFQQLLNSIGALQARTVIDGQQRLTTLQLLLDAFHAEFLTIGAAQSAQRVEGLIANPSAFCATTEDVFKVWPTNRDREAFNAVMGAEPPLDYAALGSPGSRPVEGHRYFAEQARAWLHLNGPENAVDRATKLELAVRELLQLVVIDLGVDENAQEIFETLNARGTPLMAADLIKNFVFQRLIEEGVDVEAAYAHYWRAFETGFWETEVTFGRLKYSRSSIFLNHWLIARTGDEIVAREVFSRFKRYADSQSEVPMSELIQQIKRASDGYKRFIEGQTTSNPINRLQLFAYRSSTLESEVFKPVVLWLIDPEQEAGPTREFNRALAALESWLVRRMLVRAQTSSYTQIASELVAQLRKSPRLTCGEVTEQFFADQTVGSRYWPDDREVSGSVDGLLAYKRLRRARVRMVLEAIEDHRRGWVGDVEGLGGERVARGKYHIEHVMPRKWLTNWPLESGEDEAERDNLIHTFGNLTLLTAKLNSKVSNSGWDAKLKALAEHDVLKINLDLLASADDTWTPAKIRNRTRSISADILKIWPVPAGHVSAFTTTSSSARRRVHIADLIAADMITPGTTLYARSKAHQGRTATVLPDGRIDVDGHPYNSPSGAAKAIVGRSENGWWFFLVSKSGKRSLLDVFDDYAEQSPAVIDDASDELFEED